MGENTTLHPSLNVNLLEFLAGRGNTQIYYKYTSGKYITYWGNKMEILACFIYPVLTEDVKSEYNLSNTLRRYKLIRHYYTDRWEIIVFRYRNQIIRCTTKI